MTVFCLVAWSNNFFFCFKKFLHKINASSRHAIRPWGQRQHSLPKLSNPTEISGIITKKIIISNSPLWHKWKHTSSYTRTHVISSFVCRHCTIARVPLFCYTMPRHWVIRSQRSLLIHKRRYDLEDWAYRTSKVRKWRLQKSETAYPLKQGHILQELNQIGIQHCSNLKTNRFAQPCDRIRFNEDLETNGSTANSQTSGITGRLSQLHKM